ncbi:MAG: hypothetical protein ACD_75C02085G0001, partial [uncultured bacterium]
MRIPRPSVVLFVLYLIVFSVVPVTGRSEELKVGTWKTAQTIQPFFYQDFLTGDQAKVFSFTNPADQKTALLAGSL